jgi:uncharacterized membrane protein
VQFTERRRVMLCLFVGLVAGGIASQLAPWQFAAPFVWDVAAAVFLIWVWNEISRFDSDGTRAHAQQEDTSKRSARLILIAASLVSLVGVALALVKANHTHGVEKSMLTSVAVATVALSWASVHTVFALRYAHLYYQEPDGGIDFKNKLAPDFYDFAYVAFTIGMTFQVSDTDVQKRVIRRTILGHAMLSYLFGTVIVAVTINVLASLINR